MLPACPSNVSFNDRARVIYRHRGIELAAGYGYRRGEKGFVVWCRTRGISGHLHGLQPSYSSSRGQCDESWFAEDLPWPEQIRQLGAGPSDAFLAPEPRPSPAP